MPEEIPAADGGSTEEVVTPKPVTYTDEQQNHINGLVNDSFDRAFKKAEKAAAAKLAPLQTELDELRAKLAVPPTPPAAAAPAKKDEPVADARVLEMQARLDEMKAIADQLREAERAAKAEAKLAQARGKKTRIKEEFIRAADKVDFFDRMDVFNLVEGQLDLDPESDRVVIVNPATNHPRQSVSGNMSIDEFINDFVKTKPHMVRSKAAAGGTGASEARRVEGAQPEAPVDYAALTPAQFAELRDKVLSGAHKR